MVWLIANSLPKAKRVTATAVPTVASTKAKTSPTIMWRSAVAAAFVATSSPNSHRWWIHRTRTDTIVSRYQFHTVVNNRGHHRRHHHRPNHQVNNRKRPRKPHKPRHRCTPRCTRIGTVNGRWIVERRPDTRPFRIRTGRWRTRRTDRTVPIWIVRTTVFWDRTISCRTAVVVCRTIGRTIIAGVDRKVLRCRSPRNWVKCSRKGEWRSLFVLVMGREWRRWQCRKCGMIYECFTKIDWARAKPKL